MSNRNNKEKYSLINNIYYNNDDDDIVMYILINNDLNMSKGKIASQVAHSACNIVHYLTKNSNNIFEKWMKNSSTKIVLKSNKKDMNELIQIYRNRNSDIWCDYILDEGRTQIDNGSLTSIAFCPINKKNKPYELVKLKLL